MKKIAAFVMVFALVLTALPVGALTQTESVSKQTSGVRVDENGNLLYKPEDVGTLTNPVVTGLVSPPPDSAWLAYNVTWKEEAYNFDYAYDTCAWGERDSKWVSAYVSGNPYDVITRTIFPTTAVKGLLEPLDNILPVNDTRYFTNPQVFGGVTYGITAKTAGNSTPDCGEVYGVWYNKDMFEDNGLPTPAELWENGEWTYAAMLDVAEALTQDVDRDGVIDIHGYGSWATQLFTIGNGAKTVDFTANGVELVWNTPEYINGLNFAIDMSPYSNNTNTGVDFPNGNIAMYGERIQNARYFSPTSPECLVNFEADWVPFPKGPDGSGQMGYIGEAAESVSIGKGAKNVEGAKVYICADIAKLDYVDAESATSMIGVTDEMINRVLSCKDELEIDYTNKIGKMEGIMQQLWSDMKTMGAQNAISKNTPAAQNQVFILMQGVEHTHTYDNACDAQCNLCGITREVSDHVFDSDCDRYCNVCGAEDVGSVTSKKITGLTASNVYLSYPYQRYSNNLSTMFDGDTAATDGNGMQLNWSASTDEKTVAITLNEVTDITGLNIYWGNNDWNAVPAQTYHVYFAGEDGNWGEAKVQYSDNATGQDGKLRDDFITFETPIKDVKKIIILVSAHYKKGDLAIREIEIFEGEYLPAIKADHTYDNDSDTDCNECGEQREVDSGDVDTDTLPTFVVSDASAKAGETFTVDVSVKNNSGIVGLRVYVGYDTNVLELVSATAGESFADTSFGPTTKNPFNIIWDDSLASENNVANGTVATLTFKVKEGVAAGDTKITLTYNPDDVFDLYMENVAFAVENATVTVVDYLPGDVNDDGAVNNKDLGILRRFLNDWDVEINEAASDVNADGAVNNKDLGILRRYLNDWDVELK